MERQSHNNPWADKLQEVSIPEAGEAWQAMETLLNKELPGSGRINRRRWLGFSFSAVVLAAVVYFTWFGRPSPASHSHQDSTAASSTQASPGNLRSPANSGSPGAQTPSGGTPRADKALTAPGPVTSSDSPAFSADATSSSAGPAASRGGAVPAAGSAASPSSGAALSTAGRAFSHAVPSSASTGHLPATPRSSSANVGLKKAAGSALSLRPTRHPSLHQKTHDLTATRRRNTAANRYQDIAANPANRYQNRHNTPAATAAGTTPGDASGAMRGDASLAATGNTPGVSSGAIPEQHSLHRSYPEEIQPLGIPPPGAIGGRMALPDWKNYPALPKAKSVTRSRSNSPLPVGRTGWKLAIGFNQSITVSGQQAFINRSGGVNHAWKDYIPIPSVSYYFSPKFYIQAEARFHAPQFTQKQLGFYYEVNDSLGTQLTGPIYIEKLFYFQLPVSIHYSPIPSISVGLGLEYSKYGSGIANYPDSLYSVSTPLRKYPNVHIQPSDFRGLVSLDYTFRNWVVGISYDLAFNRFLNYRLTGPAVIAPPVLARNSSLQISLRYTLWDHRKKRRSPAK